MKYFHELQIDEPTLPKSEFEELCRLKPDSKKPNGFRYKAFSIGSGGDEFISQTLSLLKGYRVPCRGQSNATHYGYRITRCYDESDFLTSELLLLNYQRRLKTLDEPQRDEAGRLLILASDAKPNLKFASTYPENRIVVSHGVRQLLKSEQLIGLKFHPMALKGKSSAAVPELPWELDSSITLPKIANTQQLSYYGYGPQPFQGDYSQLLLIKDEPFCTGELHYHRSDLVAIGSFDIANTLEKIMAPHPLVISQRFYQFCLKHKISLEVEPVRIDPD